MKQRSRKAIGILLTVGFLTAYSLSVMVGAAVYVVEAHPAMQLVFFVIAGLAWLPAVMAIINWMNRE